MNTEVIVAHEKNGTFLYASAENLLRMRIKQGFWYNGEDAKLAEMALSNGEDAAWEFLKSRSDYEYESVELDVLR